MGSSCCAHRGKEAKRQDLRHSSRCSTQIRCSVCVTELLLARERRWFCGTLVGCMLRHLFLKKKRCFFFWGGFCGVNSPSKLSSWKFQVQLPNFSMILPAGVIRDDFVFLGHGSCVNQPLGPAGGVKPEALPFFFDGSRVMLPAGA